MVKSVGAVVTLLRISVLELPHRSSGYSLNFKWSLARAWPCLGVGVLVPLSLFFIAAQHVSVFGSLAASFFDLFFALGSRREFCVFVMAFRIRFSVLGCYVVRARVVYITAK